MRRLALGVVLTACLPLACAGRSTGPALRNVRMALSTDAITWLPIHLARTLGYYEEEGLSVAVSDVPGLSKAVEALLGGSVDVAGASSLLVIQLAAEDRPVQSFLTLYSVPYYALAVAPAATGTIRSISDLKGRRVGISSPGSPTQLILNYILAANGLAPEDVRTVSIGAGASSLAAIEHGQVDAAAVVGSAINMLEQRHPQLRLLSDTRTPRGAMAVFGSETFPSTSLVSNVEWLRTNGDTAQRLVRATRKAMDWMRSHTAEEVRTQMSESLRQPDATADLDAIRTAQRTLSADGRMPSEGPELVRKVLAATNAKARSATLDLTRTYNNEFIPHP